MARVRIALPRRRGDARWSSASTPKPIVAPLAARVTALRGRWVGEVGAGSEVRATVRIARGGSARLGGAWPYRTLARANQVPAAPGLGHAGAERQGTFCFRASTAGIPRAASA